MLKQLKKCLESEKKDTDIFDIIIYGSRVKGKSQANDTDIIVIFLQGTLRERLDKIQAIKYKLKNLDKNIDIKQILITDLFLSSFMARTGIIMEGISVFKKIKFSETLGFRSYTLFWYDLKAHSHSQKVKFNYILAGRGSMKGMIKELDGQRLASGVVKIPIEKSIEFEEVLIANKISYKRKDILESS